MGRLRHGVPYLKSLGDVKSFARKAYHLRKRPCDTKIMFAEMRYGFI
jgi:hypothetical protein